MCGLSRMPDRQGVVPPAHRVLHHARLLLPCVAQPRGPPGPRQRVHAADW